MSSDKSQGTILIVDDNPTNLQLLSGMLRDRSYEVRVATSGRQAIASARTARPDLIMLDIMMPNMNGYETCQQLKADASTRDVPVIFISALDQVMDKVKAFHAGGADYVAKPFQIEEVVARIENQLNISRLQKDLQEATLRLKEVDRLKADFTAMLVHDLKSPLSSIKGTLGLFQERDGVSDEELSELASLCERNVDTMLNLIGEVLELSRSESADMRIERAPMDLAQLLRECVIATRLAALKHEITIEHRLPAQLPTILGDRQKLERVFSNLLSNAVKFTPAGGRISVAAETVDGTDVESGLRMVYVSVTDTGEGIAAEEIPYLFDPYRQAAGRNRSLGVGLGLAIAKRIVAAHGGNIVVRSKRGVGSRFTVILPTEHSTGSGSDLA
jgi:two-component system, sensor histidine kinase and response regulator